MSNETLTVAIIFVGLVAGVALGIALAVWQELRR